MTVPIRAQRGVLKPRERNIFMPPGEVALGCIQLRS
jgi:hypothetical protein